MSLPIILLHGFPFDGSMWRHQAAFLRARGRHVLAPDLAGFGVSPAIPAPAAAESTMENYAEDVHQLIGHNGGRAIVGGFSMGGYVLLALLRAHGGDVAGAMLIDTRAEADAPEARANRLKSIDEVRGGGTAGLVETLLGRLLGPQAGDAVREETRGMMRRQSPGAVMAAQSAMARRRDQTDLLASLTIPALIVVGKDDVITPPAAARAMREGISGSRLVEIPNAGHMTPLEAPEALGQAINDFVQPSKKW